MMHYWYEHGCGIRAISRLFHCNKRLVQFELFPERKVKNLQDRKDRGGSKIYYKKEKQTPSIKKHRRYKHSLRKFLIHETLPTPIQTMEKIFVCEINSD